MITGSVKLISSNRDIVTKVYIPKYFLLLSKSFTYVFKMLISFVIAIILVVVLGVTFTFNILYFFMLFPMFYIFTFGLSCIVMHLGVFVEDLQNLTKICLRLLFYMSGVFYNIGQRLNGTIESIMLNFNPVAFYLSEMRNVLIYGLQPSFIILFVWFFIGMALFFFWYSYYS